MIIGICTGTIAAVLIVFVWLGIHITGKTNEAKDSVAEFVTCLQNGELERLRVEYYAYSQEENIIYRDENGVVRGQTLTRQQVAEIYGADAVMGVGNSSDTAGTEADRKENVTDEALIKLLMKYTQIQANVGTVFGDNTEIGLQMLTPDLKTWLLNLSEEDLKILNAIESGSELLEEMEERITSGKIPQQYIRLTIPMVKQNGRWRFEVTDETEQAFFGGLYHL